MEKKIKGMFGCPERADEVKKWLRSQGASSTRREIEKDKIYFVTDHEVMCCPIAVRDAFDIEALPKRYDLKPFDKVLVRHSEDERWRCDIFSYYDVELSEYRCIGLCWAFCIPFEGNEHLVGTTDMPENE